MTRVARVFGPLILMGKDGIQAAAAYSQYFEASPIYQNVNVSLRIWGSRTINLGGGVSRTETINQTESVDFVRSAATQLGQTGMPQLEFTYPAGGPARGGPDSSAVGIANKYGVSASIATEEITGTFFVDQAEVLWNSFNAPYTPAPGDTFAGRINPKEQRLIVGGTPSSDPVRTFVFEQTDTPPGTPVNVNRNTTLAPPSWFSVVAIPARGRGKRELWGYGFVSTTYGASPTGLVDTSAWSATQWRDYRGTWVFPAQDLTVGWDSGTMQQQYTVIIS